MFTYLLCLSYIFTCPLQTTEVGHPQKETHEETQQLNLLEDSYT